MLDRSWRIVALFACLLLSAWTDAFAQAAKIEGKLSPPSFTPSNYKVGSAFRKFVPADKVYNWRGAKTHVLAGAVWYPAAASAVEHPVEIPGLSQIFILGNAAQDA